MISHLHPYTINHLHDAECIKHLGKGAFGEVKLYKCKDKNKDNNCLCNKFFVVKKINCDKYNQHPYIIKKLRKNMLNEYTIGTLLHHPYIIETLDVDLQDNSIIFEYYPGIDFFNYIKHGKPSFKDEVLYFKQCLEGVSYMHDIGVAHMDLKLENIVINTDNKTIKIIDFGESRVFHESLHINSIIPEKGLHGSLPYMAPEEFENKEYNPEKVDVWSCGIILYEIVYNSFPWVKAQIEDVRYKNYITCIKDDCLYKILPNYSSRDIIYKMLTPNPDNRGTISEIHSDLSKLEYNI